MSRANVRPEDLPRMLSAVKRRCQALGGDEEEMITYGSRIVPANLPESAFNWLRSGRVRDITFCWRWPGWNPDVGLQTVFVPGELVKGFCVGAWLRA